MKCLTVALLIPVWLALTSVMPPPHWQARYSPAVVRAQPCTAENAGITLRQEVTDPDNGFNYPIGRAVAWSCTSFDEAQQNLNVEVTRVKTQAACWYGKGKKPVPCPAKP